MLFGHKKGGGPGAGENKTGLIKRADKGTLFLNEISELPLPVQKSLLRVMESRAFVPLGAETEETCNFRVIASTTKDLEALSKKRKFNKDFLVRLKGIDIHLPPLRRIQGDMIKMALYYLDQHCRTYKIDTKGISPECLDILTAYEWPGNAGELAEALDKAVASAKNEPTLYSIHLPSYIRAKVIKKSFMPDSKSKNNFSGDYDQGNFPILSQVLETAEKEYLNAVLSHTGQNLKEACRISGISKSRMHSKLKKYMLN